MKLTQKARVAAARTRFLAGRWGSRARAITVISESTAERRVRPVVDMRSDVSDVLPSARVTSMRDEPRTRPEARVVACSRAHLLRVVCNQSEARAWAFRGGRRRSARSCTRNEGAGDPNPTRAGGAWSLGGEGREEEVRRGVGGAAEGECRGGGGAHVLGDDFQRTPRAPPSSPASSSTSTGTGPITPVQSPCSLMRPFSSRTICKSGTSASL